MTTANRPTASPAEVTIANQASYTVRFEITECGRCGGTGYWGPSSVAGGRCFDCVGGTRCTRRGEAAKEAFDAVMDELMLVPVLDVRAGDQVWLDHKWRTLTEATERTTHGSMTVGAGANAVTTAWTREMWLTYTSRGTIIMAEIFKIRRYTPEARLAMLHRMCSVAGAFVELKKPAAA